jgi:adenylate kinase
MRVVITGNPGVGKHSCAFFVSERLPNSQIIDINSIIVNNNTYLTSRVDVTEEIDIRKIKNILIRRIAQSNNLVIVGHLAPYVLTAKGISLVAVLRRSPYQLQEIFRQRKYTYYQSKENIAAEILGITFYDSLRTFGERRIVELDVTRRTPQDIAADIISNLQKKSKKQLGIVDWLAAVYERGDAQKLLEY